MGSELLIRSYNVGCGDCIYVRIPNGKNDNFHMLIDCGTKDSPGALEAAIADMRDNFLPDEGEHKRLDLIVVTHLHEDHIKGFDPKYFKNITIKNLWMSAAMNKKHPQAERSMALHAFAEKEMKALMDVPGMALSPELAGLVALYGINNKSAVDALTNGKLGETKVDPEFVYVGYPFKKPLKIKDTSITVLGPEEDIDRYYLGKEADVRLKGLQEGSANFISNTSTNALEQPINISSADFRTLQSRMISNGLAFADKNEKLINNTSTVLLIEWQGRRLLFVGDAEWDSEFKEGKQNGSWNVMWEVNKKHLSKPVDFLKVGHHGSQNATPWDRNEPIDQGVNQILNSILPLPKGNKKPTAQCVVSTKRKQYETIPDAKLLTELGRRVSNTEIYSKLFKKNNPDFDPENDIFQYSFLKPYKGSPEPVEVGDKGWLEMPQPKRTDFESNNFGSADWNKELTFVDIFIKPKSD